MTEVGSPRARKEGGDRRQPSRRAVSAPPQPPPDNVDIASSGAPETSKDGQGMATGARTEKRNGRSAQDAGPKNRQPFPPPPPSDADGRSVDVVDKWAQKGRDGRVFHVMRQGEALHALSRRFATTSGFANPLPVSCRHLYTLYFLIIWDLRHSGLSRALFQIHPTHETGNGMPTSLFHQHQRSYPSSAV